MRLGSFLAAVVLVLSVPVLPVQGEEVRTLTQHWSRVFCVAFSPDGTTLASGSYDSRVMLWNPSAGKVVRTLAQPAPVGCVVFCPDGKLLAIGPTDETIRLWDSVAGTLLRTLASDPPRSVSSLAFSPDGRILVSGSWNNTISLWDPLTGKLLQTLTGHREAVLSVAFSPDGKVLASGSGDRTVKLWDPATGTLLRTLIGHTSDVWSVAFSPDGKALASGSADGTVKLWNPSAGTPLLTLTGHTDGVLSVAFSHDGKALASGSSDETVRLWEATTGRLLCTLTGHTSAVSSVAFSPDGEILASGSWDATVKLWDVAALGVAGLVPPQPPVAVFASSPASPFALDQVQFSDASTDPDGSVVAWLWEFGDESISTEQNPIHSYLHKGTFTVTLTVTDKEGLKGAKTQTVTVANRPPDALFGLSPQHPVVGFPVRFNASASQDLDGEIRSYAWDFDGDGKTDATGIDATHTFLETQTYSVTLTVTDDEGTTSTARDEVAASAGEVQAKEIWALLVGVSKYQDAGWNLRYAREDALAMLEGMVRPARVPADHVRVLVDDQATLVQVQSGLEWLRRNAGPDDLVIFYFSGHGYQGEDLFPKDEKDGLDEYFVLYDTVRDAIEATAFRDDEFGQLLDRIDSQHVLVLFDSCYSGGQERGQRGLPRGGKPVGDTYDVWGDFDLEGRLVLSASAENEQSWEDDKLQQGVFTHFLIRGLEGKADADGEGRVTAEELYRYVSDKVPEYVKVEKGAEQHPKLVGEGNPGVVIARQNRCPDPQFSYKPQAPLPEREIQFFDASKDDGTIIAWAWEFGDGATSTEQNPAHVYAQEGTYAVALTVTDEADCKDSVTHEIRVGPLGEVAGAYGDYIVISLGSAHGVQVGDRFEVVHFLVLPDGTVGQELRAVIEVQSVLEPRRSACVVVKLLFPIETGDRIRPAR